MAEHKAAEAVVANPGPRKQVAQRGQAKKRHQLKENYMKARQMRGADRSKLVGEFLCIMGHNVITSTMIGRNTNLEYSEDPNNVIEENSNNISNWQILNESNLEEIDEGENPYKHRKVGVSKKTQEKQQMESSQWWRGAKCPSCNTGFTSRSKQKQCHSCDKYSHIKKQCLSMSEEDTGVFLCKKCNSCSGDLASRTSTGKNSFKCKRCDYKTW